MYLPMPVLAALAIAVLVLIFLVLRRRGERDLMSPPSLGAPAPPPRAWPAGSALGRELPAELEAEVRRLIAAGNKIEAIRQVRAATHLGLTEAKEMVERM